MIAGFKFSLLLIPFAILFCGQLLGQDGSDMNYLTPNKLDQTFIGRRVHIDFYRDSRGCSRAMGKEQDSTRCDKVVLSIDDRPTEFKEHREDDWFNNWFRDQYLETTDKQLRLREFKLTGIAGRTLTFIGYFNVAPFEREFTFAKADVFKLLFKEMK